MTAAWPNGARVAVAVAVMFEAWSQGRGPAYSVQTTQLRPGEPDRAAASWGTYGGRVGVWRLARTLERHHAHATFFTSARAAELYPDACARLTAAGHALAGHGTAQDALLLRMTRDEERAAIASALDTLERCSGSRPAGWLSPVLATTEHTREELVRAGVRWHADVNDDDYPYLTQTPAGPLVAIPHSDFVDNRVLRGTPRAYFDTYRDTLRYLYAHEPGALLVVGIHAHFGGRPLMCALFDEILALVDSLPGAAYVTHAQLAEWFHAGTVATTTYAQRYDDVTS